MSCSTISTGMCARCVFTRSETRSRSAAARPASGSSSSSTCGLEPSAMPRSTRRCPPYDRSLPRVSSMPCRPRNFISSAVSAWISAVAVDVAPGVEARGVPRLQRQAQVLVDRQALEQVGDLERARQALLADAVRAPGGGSLAPCSAHRAPVGREHARDEVERGRLAGAVGADQRVHLAGARRRATRCDGANAAEALVDAAHLEHRARRAARAQEAGQRQSFVDLAPAHRRALLRRRPPAALQLCPRCRPDPVGEKITKPTKIRPNHSSQLSVQIENSSRNSR